MTLYQSLVTAVLGELQFEFVPGPHGIMGGPSQWKVTEDTISHLKAMVGKTITVEGDGKMQTQ